MSAPAAADGAHVVAFEVYGSRVSVTVPRPELVHRVVDQLPIDSTRCAPEPGDHRFGLEIGDDGRYAVVQDGTVLARPPALEGALDTLRRRLFRHAIEHARDRLAVHAGVVAHEGRAIVLPGPAMIGKTSLVIALVKAGAVYYTDDFALLDGDGLAHPYPNLLYIKNEDKLRVESIGGVRGDRPLPVGLIASITFKPGSRWNPRPRTPGEGMLMLIRNAYGIDVPGFAMEAARRAAANAFVLEGERDDPAEVVAALLKLVTETAAQAPPSGGSR